MLNEHERKIYDFIKKSLDNGIPPTVREICKELGYPSTSTVNKYIDNLREKGLIEKNSNQKRSIKIKSFKAVNIPFVNASSYSENFLNVENIKGYICWNPDMEYEYPLFAMRVESDYSSLIQKNDIVIAERTFHDGKRYYIMPENRRLVITEKYSLHCIGRIISVIKYL